MNEKKIPADLVWADGDGDEFRVRVPHGAPTTPSAALVATPGDVVYLTAAQCREVAAHLTALADYHEETMPRTAPALPTDPTALAREVLDAVKVMDGTPGLLYLDGPTHEHEEAAGAILAAAPTLARTVIDLTATIKRVEALADDMDHDADLVDQTDDLRLHLIAATHREDATRLRAALNGGDQ